MIYILYPGQVCSKHDGQWHYISYDKLIKLYELDPKNCINGEEPGLQSFRLKTGLSKSIKLYPRFEGDYKDFLNKRLDYRSTVGKRIS